MPTKNPVTGSLTKTLKNAVTTVTPTSLGTLNPVNLPSNFEITLPDIAQSAQSAVGFKPNTGLERVSDSQRQEDAIVYKEQLNAAENLKDSIKVARAYVQAGVEATKLGQALIQYATGLETVKTEQVKLSQAQTKTSIAQSELNELQERDRFLKESFEPIKAEYDSKLSELKSRAERARLKAEDYIRETSQLFPGR